MTSLAKRLLILFVILLGLFLGAATPSTYASSSSGQNSSSTESAIEEDDAPSSLSLYYFGIFYGPTLGRSDELHPALDTRNYLTLNSSLKKGTVFGVTVGWNWQGIPNETPTLRDPFLKLGRSDLLPPGSLSWYGDLRVHLPVTQESRDRDLWMGLQTFHSLLWEPGKVAGAGLSVSVRYNRFGGEGQGDDWEYYLGPSVFWNFSPRLGLNVLFEWGAGRPYGQNTGLLLSNGLDVEPGLNWRLNNHLLLNPYLTIPLDQTSTELTGGPSLGMTLSWQWL